MKTGHDIKMHTAIAALLLLGATALGACSHDDEADTREMRFGVSGESTRATEALGPGYRLWAWALYHYDATTASSLYFGGTSGLELTYREADNCYAAENYFFPYLGDIDFLAYGTNASTQPTVSYSRESLAAGSTFTSLSINVGSLAGRYEAIYAEPLNVVCAPTVTPVLHFHRPMANLRFVFQAADEETCRQVRFNYIEVQGTTWQGTCVFNYKTNAVQWTGKGTSGNVRVDNFAGGQIPSASEPLTAGLGLYIVPQSTRVRILVNYTMINQPKADATRSNYVENYGDSPVGTTERTVNYIVNQKAEDMEKGWLAGHQYTYHIYVRGAEQMEVTQLHVEEVKDAPTGNLRI